MEREHAETERVGSVAASGRSDGARPFVATLAGGALTPAAVLALQRAAGNGTVSAVLARRRLLRETNDIEQQFRERRSQVNDTAVRKAKEFVAGGQLWGVDAPRLFFYLVKEYAPAYHGRVRSVYDPTANDKFAAQKERALDAASGRVSETGKWNVVVGPSLVRRVANGELGPVTTELMAALRAVDTGVLDGSAEVTIQVGDEQVDVRTTAERDEAERISKTLKDEYGIELNSVRGLEGMRRKHPGLPSDKEAIDTVQRVPWKLKELAALERAAKHFAPILGSRRADSARKDDFQEVTTAAKLTNSLTDTTKQDLDTLGEFYRGMQLMWMFQVGTESKANFPDTEKQLEATATHELTHGLLRFAEEDFRKTIGYWREFAERAGRGAEAPPSKYGDWNVAEDLAESVMYFFVDPQRLKAGDGTPPGKPGNPCPRRHAYIERLTRTWSVAQPAPPRGKVAH